MSDTPHLQYYDVQTLEYRYISKLPMKNERIWSYVKETTSHLQNKLTKKINLGVATRSSTKWDCLKPKRFLQKCLHYGFHSFPVVDWFCLFISLQSQEILNRPVFVLEILKSVWKFWKLLKILKIAENSEQILKILNILKIAENSEQILNIIFLLKSIYFTSFSLDFS
jgi:hypothetical protein